MQFTSTEGMSDDAFIYECESEIDILGLQPRDKAAMLGVRKKELFS